MDNANASTNASANLRAVRLSANIDQTQLAFLSGLASSTLGNLELGHCPFSQTRISALTKTLGITWKQLNADPVLFSDETLTMASDNLITRYALHSELLVLTMDQIRVQDDQSYVDVEVILPVNDIPSEVPIPVECALRSNPATVQLRQGYMTVTIHPDDAELVEFSASFLRKALG